MADRPTSPIFSGPLPSSFDDDKDFYDERVVHKVVRKLKEEPLIPLGIGLTCLAFTNAYRALKRGDSHQANRMFRARIAAQGFTIIAMVAGSIYYSQDREKIKELRKLKEQRDAEEKRQRWIRELEIRDQEEKALQARFKQSKGQALLDDAKAEQVDPSLDGAGVSRVLEKVGPWPHRETQTKSRNTPNLSGEMPQNGKKSPEPASGPMGSTTSDHELDATVERISRRSP